ncbi:MAG: 3-dehydroquinate synthase [Chloroflexi bacterium]|nr:3-dehydroquinate synthase [Chloroflexota bacterium]
MGTPENIILIGFSYTGKTQAGRLAAKRLGWDFVDTDDLVVQMAGKTVDAVFAEHGEAGFRDVEREALQKACSKSHTVISTGGGAVIASENRALMLRSGAVICLDSSPQKIVERMRAAKGEARPLLSGSNPLARIAALKVERQAWYAQAQRTINTDGMTVEQTADEIVRAYHTIASNKASKMVDTPAHFADAAYVVETKGGVYPGYVGWGILNDLGKRMREVGLSGTAYVFAETPVFSKYGRKVLASLKEAEFRVDHHFLASGEANKSLASAEKAYAWLASKQAERGHVIVAMGGGMTGDLAGYVAATYLRGMPFVQVPTTLLAMTDASIGGKVAVNLPAGKNLIGAFYQPRLVLADTETLATLPKREVIAGWAETIKHALILDRQLFTDLQGLVSKLLALEPDATTATVRRSAAIKARVVSEDERETGGPRTLLNYGHTVGHALESAFNYEAMLHGEAISVGMAAAGYLSSKLGMLSSSDLRAQNDLLRAFGLPLQSPPVQRDMLRQAMALDKKVAGKAIRWVLLEGIGKSTTRNDVPDALVDEALGQVVEQ